KRQVLFIDELHRLQPTLEELLYSALEDYKLDILIGQGPAARTHTMDVKPFTFVGATTRAGLLSSPLRSRFGIVLRLEFYSDEDLRIIVERSAEILAIEIDGAGAAEAEESDAIEEIYEPFLIQIGFLNRTPRGRVATQLAYEHFGIATNRRQSSLF